MVCNDIAKLTKTVLKFRLQNVLCLQRDNTQENGGRYHVAPKAILQKWARTTKHQLTIFLKWHPCLHCVGQLTEMMRYFDKARTILSDELKKRENILKVESLKKPEQEQENE